MRRGTFVLFAVLLAMSIFSVPTLAVGLVPSTYYVDINNGTDDPAKGSSPGAGAWKTLHYAVGEINAGSPGTYTLNVASGTYEVVATEKEANTPLDITQDNVTVIGDFNSRPILSGPANPQAGEWAIGIITSGNNITIRDLEIRNFSYGGGIFVQGDSSTVYNCDVHNNGPTGILVSPYEPYINDVTIKRCNVYSNVTGIVVTGAQDTVVEQNYVYNNTGGETGIDISNISTGVVIKKNLIVNNPTGIYIWACSPLVERNEIKDNEVGIAISGNASPEIYNNLIYDTASAMNDGIMVDALYASSAAPFIYHNTIDHGIGHGIYMYGYMGSCTPDILFNIITNFGTYGIFNGEYAGEYCDPSVDYNDVWHNGPSDPYDQHYSGIGPPLPSTDIHQDPLYTNYVWPGYDLPNYNEMAINSPCKDAIPLTSTPSDPLTIDLPGYKRPRGTGYDMGAYEYVADITHNYNLPGGTGQVTDYRMFTIPVYVGTGANMKTTMESYVGTYNKYQWRVFAYGSSYTEMDETGFSSLPVEPGDAFWAISLGTDLIPFTGRPAPDGEYYTMPLKSGWNMFGLPWPKGFFDIELGKIAVSDGVNNYWITSTNNTLTQKSVWDYPGTPPNVYAQLTDAADVLKPGSGYWIKVESTLPVELLIPPDNGGGYFQASAHRADQASTENAEEPPPPPGGVSSESSGIDITAEGGCFIATAAE
jgi:parallel beta-helix repeat protein